MRPLRLNLSLALLLALPVRGGERALLDLTRSPEAKMYMPDLGDVKWTGGLLAERFEVCRSTMVPHLWEILSNDSESHAWANFLIASGTEHRGDDKFHGPPFNDGDFLKWLEALAQIYAVTHDPGIDAQMDRIIAVIARAQREDGYLHTQTIIPQRQGDAQAKEFANRDHFETYNMGHLMTTACVHYRATGKTTLLACARKAADYLDQLCRAAPADLARNAICPSHYMGVVELYRATREPRYLALAKQLIEIRSLVPPDVGSDMNQDRIPFRAMTEAVGHAVRANYLYAGVADVFAEDGDASLRRTLQTISDQVTGEKLYITGMTGALYDGASPDGSSKHAVIKAVAQAYGRAYQLPNLTAYNETCANVGYALWMWRMLAITGNPQFADLFEQSLYNGVLPGISLDGKNYFYVNALRKLKDFDVPLRWSRTRTPNIKSSFCCPPNVVRTIAEAHNYVYALSANTLWVNLYAATELNTTTKEGVRIRLRQETDYPWSGRVRITFDEAPPGQMAVKLRIPGWLHEGAATVRVHVAAGGSNSTDTTPAPGTYCALDRTWRAGDAIEVAFDFRPTVWEANPLVEETLNQVAVRYGPMIYCLESNDLPPGAKLMNVALDRESATAWQPKRQKIGPTDIVALLGPAWAIQRAPWDSKQLYRESRRSETRAIAVTLVPYYAWGNRGDTEMSVWLPAR